MNKFRVITATGRDVEPGYVITRIATNEYWDFVDVTDGEFLVVRKMSISGDTQTRIMPPEAFGVGVAFADNGGPRSDKWSFRPDWAASASVSECVAELRRNWDDDAI